uniref:Cytochrome c oxidase subunit 2 n=1 Tax=Cheiracanthium brevispinum TaxID=2773961 RepID=A0AA51VIX1_9ARAC|nr:cytochrome c oxidase subunit II [Cheiracanthium brevispinum]WMX19908.1 cytochrome c oxidase subunit II [Cheiracanthium brevispinum]
MSVWGSLYFQNGVSPVMEYLIFFHDYTMMIMIMIMVIVGYMLVSSCLNNFFNLKLFEGQELESIWTVLPAIFLLFIAFPSLRLLYLMEESSDYDLTIKVMGHQWYWSYEYSNFDFNVFDSYMKSDEDSMFRLLNVDNCLAVPYNSMIRMIVASSDVIHSWTIPSLGVKADAIPGRLNQLMLLFNRVGVFSGQCSEICGANHSFMPILILVMPQVKFLSML